MFKHINIESFKVYIIIMIVSNLQEYTINMKHLSTQLNWKMNQNYFLLIRFGMPYDARLA